MRTKPLASSPTSLSPAKLLRERATSSVVSAFGPASFVMLKVAHGPSRRDSPSASAASVLVEIKAWLDAMIDRRGIDHGGNGFFSTSAGVSARAARVSAVAPTTIARKIRFICGARVVHPIMFAGQRSLAMGGKSLYGPVSRA